MGGSVSLAWLELGPGLSFAMTTGQSCPKSKNKGNINENVNLCFNLGIFFRRSKKKFINTVVMFDIQSYTVK